MSVDDPKLGRSFQAGRLRSGLFEACVIALGILLAFSVDAWWDGVQARRALAKSLASIRAEVTLNLESLERAIPIHDQTAAAGLDLLALTGPGADEEVAEQAIGLLVPLMFSTTARLNQSALTSLLESGRLGDLDRPELQDAVAGLPADLSLLAYFEGEVGRMMREVLFPRIWLYVPQLDSELANGLDQGPLLEEFRAAAPERSRFEADFVGLLGDLEFENALVERTTLAIFTRNHAEELAQLLRGVLLLLDEGRS